MATCIRLGFDHPRTGHYLEVESQYPTDLQHALDAMREGIL